MAKTDVIVFDCHYYN